MGEDRFGGGVKRKSGGDEEEARRVRAEVLAREVVPCREVIGGGVVSDAHPIIEGLEGQVDILLGFDFDDGEAAGVIDGEDVGDAAVEAGDGNDLGVEGLGEEGGVEGLDVAVELGFEDGFRVEEIGLAGLGGEEFGVEVAAIGGVKFVGNPLGGVGKEAELDTGEVAEAEGGGG